MNRETNIATGTKMGARPGRLGTNIASGTTLGGRSLALIALPIKSDIFKRWRSRFCVLNYGSVRAERDSTADYDRSDHYFLMVIGNGSWFGSTACRHPTRSEGANNSEFEPALIHGSQPRRD